MRIGIGFDAHCFIASRPLILGGIEIPYHLGLEGHSDADVVVHAIIDALLGSISAGDIGEHFPDTEEQYKDISSLILLKKTRQFLDEKKYKISNIDIVVILEEPKLNIYKNKIKERLASVLEVKSGQIGIKATTTEKMGFTGRKEGIAAQAVVLVEDIT
jgi:2-C-methyl-D-erythritol 2,4-cyclodiphosphate synthase